MQFKHPEILYALLLLIIPILVHLFQLQRFVKVPFTNVKFLKTIEKQTRKSARLKKWLILATRLLIFFCLVFAFSQPYFSKYTNQQNSNTTIFLDNSFSMQAKGNQGELLKNAAKDIIENNTVQNNSISFGTNDKYLTQLDGQNLKTELISIKYHPNKFDLNTVLLKIDQSNLSEKNSLDKTILISDFQNIDLQNKTNFTNVNSTLFLIKLNSKEKSNFFIDSVYQFEETALTTKVKVIVKSNKNNSESIPISLFNEEKLIGKTTSRFDNSNVSTIEFDIPTTSNFNGKISLIDDALEFDNDFFFSISKPDKINVLSIGISSNYLPKIYTKNEFNYNSFPLKNLNYNILQNQHLIILNELENIPSELINSLQGFTKNGGSLVIIPSVKSNIDSYNNLLRTFNLGKIINKVENNYQITSINYDHPLIKDVFEKRVDNFQYPKTNLYYQTKFNNTSAIISLDNNLHFISSQKTKNNLIYWVGSPLSINITDFTQSPLIVPVFYNFAKSSLKTGQLYYTINSNVSLDVKTKIGKDNVLKISNGTSEFIPLQTVSQNSVRLQPENNIIKSGFYNVLNNNTTIKTLAFNYNREESILNYTKLESLIKNKNNVIISPSIKDAFNEINNQQKINWLFKWFLAFSVLFLLIEMLILKYFNK
ncbi:MAG: BatA domain-containing protein [Lutibacter sp.]|nr:BatA domain-containing protein [Lutibacter sp.]